MNVRTWHVLCAVTTWAALGCGGSNHAAPITAAKVAGAAAQALTDGLTFEGGIVEAGALPDTTAQNVKLHLSDGPLQLVPAQSSLMPLDVSNPDEASDPIKSTLIQFGDSKSHVEVPRKQTDGGVGGSSTAANGIVHLDIKVGVGTDICKDLCKGKLHVNMLLAALLTSGAVGEHATRDVALDCSDDGDPAKCGASGPPAAPSPSACSSGQNRCSGNGVETCGGDGQWGVATACVDQTCVLGVCTGVCAPGQKQCKKLVPQSCDATGAWKDGTACGSTCNAGACGESAAITDAGAIDAGATDAGTPMIKDAAPACVGGAACAFTANACHEGVYVCDKDGNRTCQDNGPKVNGNECGTDHVCFAGNCIACKIGDPCSTGKDCEDGAFDSCGNGSNGPHCALQGATAAGTACSSMPNYVCSVGACVFCQASAGCTPRPDPSANPNGDCHNGSTNCSKGPVCVDLGTNAPDGTPCTSNGGQYCLAGVCSPCHAGDSCALPLDPCRAGQISCGGTGPTCTATGGVATDGTGCASGKVCMTGSCVSTSWTLAVQSGDGQMKPVDSLLAPVTLSVKDQNNAPVASVVIQVTSPAGSYAPATVVTNSSGIATLAPRLGRALGTYTFAVSSTAAPTVNFTATAIAPAKNTIFNVVDVSHANGQDGLGGPATMAHISNDYAVVAASDGTLYVADQCSVYAVTPSGVISRLAGTGTCGSSGGDIGAATAIQLYYVYDLALDETNGFLYIADYYNHKVRQLDLGNHTMQTYAGGGTTTASDYGDNGSATLAVLSYPQTLSVDPAGNLYIGDTSHNRIRKVDTAQTITTFFLPSSTCPQGLALYSCSTNCGVKWDATGQGFVAGSFCGSATNNSSVNGVARIEANGSLTLVAGSSTSSATGDDMQASAAYFSNVPRIAFDKAGNLFTSDQSANKIRRIDSATGLITTVAGDGTANYKGDYGDGLSGTSAELNYPLAISLDGAGNLYVADSSNYTTRAIWGVGDTTANTITLARSAGEGQNVDIDALFNPPLAVSLTDAFSKLIAGASITWQAVDAGSGLASATSTTTLSGIASMSGRPGLAPGAYRFTARYRDVHGNDATNSPVTFTVNAGAPTGGAGTVFTIVNTDHASGSSSGPIAGTYAHTTSYATSVAAGSDGTLYLADYCQVSTLSPQGVYRALAGSGSCVSTGGVGDGGAAISAAFYDIEGLLLDERNANNRLLYVNDHYNARVRVITLDTNPPRIDTVVGFTGTGTPPGAPDYGVPGPGTGVKLGNVASMAMNPADGNLYLIEASNNPRILQVDSTGYVTSWLAPNSSCTGPINLYSLPANSGMAWAPGNILYIYSYLCGTNTGNSGVYGVVKRDMTGAITWIAGQTSGAGSQADGTPATNTYFPNAGPLALGPGGASLYLAADGSNVIRKISALNGTGTVSTVAGTGATPYSGDYVQASTAQFNRPWALTFTPGGHLVLADYYNDAFREIW